MGDNQECNLESMWWPLLIYYVNLSPSSRMRWWATIKSVILSIDSNISKPSRTPTYGCACKLSYPSNINISTIIHLPWELLTNDRIWRHIKCVHNDSQDCNLEHRLRNDKTLHHKHWFSYAHRLGCTSCSFTMSMYHQAVEWGTK